MSEKSEKSEKNLNFLSEQIPRGFGKIWKKEKKIEKK